MIAAGRTSCFSKLNKPILVPPQVMIRTFSNVHESCMVVKDATKLSLQLQKHFDDKFIVFSAPGLSSLLVFRDTDSSVFKVLEDNDYDGMIQSISKAILNECKHLVHNKMSTPFV